MLCKYCHKKDHLIDNCPSIICRKCGKIGHPKWLCPNTKKITECTKIDTKSKYKTFNTKKPNEELEEKNIKYYLKLINKNYNWGDILFNDFEIKN